MAGGTKECPHVEQTVNIISRSTPLTLQTVILAAGMGSRLGRSLPKPMLPAQIVGAIMAAFAGR